MFTDFLKNNSICAAFTGIFIQFMSFIIANHMAILGSLTAIVGFVIVVYTARIKKKERELQDVEAQNKTLEQEKLKLELAELHRKADAQKAIERLF